MKKVLVFCALIALWLSLDGSSVWAIDVGWMQKGVRVWYFGSAGTVGSSDAEEAYLFASINGNNAQLTHHSGINHWTLPTVDTNTYSVLDQGPCWIHPHVLQNIAIGDTWMGIKITYRDPATLYTYNQFKNTGELSSLPYLLLPIKALFDLKPQRELIRLVYGRQYLDPVWGTAYFDAETGLCLYNLRLTVSNTVWGILSEINYDFATQKAFAEDNGPHTGFKSNATKSSTPLNLVDIEANVETRYGDTVQMWASTQAGGSISSFLPIDENYCFFGSVPVLRHKLMTATPQYPPENWNEYGQYLWWWVPQEALQNSTINIFDVSMNRTDTDPYTFEANVGTGLYFSKIIFDNDGYMTSFCAKDSSLGLDLCAGSTLYNDTTVNGLDYYKNTMKIAKPDAVVYVDFAGYGLYQWDGATWTLINGTHPTRMVASGSSLYADFASYGLYQRNGATWTLINANHPASMVASGSFLYADFASYGLYQWNGTAWTRINGSHPASMVASGSVLYADFASYGLYQWDGATWTLMSGSHPVSMVASGSFLYADFASYGLYQWNGNAWTQINGSHPASMVASGSVLYADFASYGIYQWNGATWTLMSGGHPASMVVSGSFLYADFASYGLYQWNGATWAQINGGHPASMVVSGSFLYADFASYGLYQWNGATWAQINGNHPASMMAN